MDDDVPERESRKKIQKPSRLAALEALKKSKIRGEKHKYELEATFERVYDIVDESEYSERVRARLDDDWIVNDAGGGYVEDGREIFDDDFDYVDNTDVPGKKPTKFKSKNPNVCNPDSTAPKKNTPDLKTYFSNVSSSGPRKSDCISSVDDEQLLSEVINQYSSSSSKKSSSAKLSSTGADKKLFGTYVPKSNVVGFSNPFTKQQNVIVKRLPTSPAKGYSPVKHPPRKIIKESLTPTKVHIISATDNGHASKVKGMTGGRTLFASTAVEDFSAQDSGIDSCPMEDELAELKISQFDSQTSVEVGQQLVDDKIGEFPTQSIDKNDVIDDEILTDICSDEMDSMDFHVDFVNKQSSVDDFCAKLNDSCNKLDSNMQMMSEPGTPTSSATLVKFEDLEFKTTEDGKRVLKFYLFDSCEGPSPGIVFLFGRVYDKRKKCHVSCSVMVKNIRRRFWLLPREQKIDKKTGKPYGETLTFEDVHSELVSLTDRRGIKNIRVKPVDKKYSAVGTLNVDAPGETSYLELRYDFSYPALPADLTGETFSAVFGSTSSTLELFLLEQKIKGPRWLEIIDPAPADGRKVTYCATEFSIEKPSCVQPTNETSQPSVRCVILKLQTMPNARNEQEVIAAGLWKKSIFEFDKDASYHHEWQHVCVITKGTGETFPFDFRDKLSKQSITTVEIVGNERALINFLLAQLQNFDPDIIIGHDLLNFELPNLLQRIAANKIKNWFSLGRLKRSEETKLNMHKSALHEITVGRLLCDVGVMARELIRSKDYDLSGLVLELFAKNRPEILSEQVKLMYSSSENLMHLIKSIKMDCFWILRISAKLQCLPLAAEISRIVGGVLSKTLMGGRAERTEFLLLHALETLGYIYPDKVGHSKKRGTFEEPIKEELGDPTEVGQHTTLNKKKAAYAGGLVLEPKKGLYDQYVVLLDFNSLYPSIMQEFNICFTTINLLQHRRSNADEDVLPNLPDSSFELGVLPSEIRKLVESRRAVKRLMKDPNVSTELLQQYTIRQQALKITANSMYGCLGFGNSRFYAKPLAALITGKGREILMNTKDLVESMGLDVIYGDTDSIMINTNCNVYDDVLVVAKKVKTEVNKKYHLLEIEMDGVYKKLLLLKKKKYAGLSVELRPDGTEVCKKEVKGLDIVRRDWSSISIEAGEYVLSEILSDRGLDETLEQIHEYLQNLATEIRNFKVEVEKFLISKQLTKSPSEYTDKKSLPHVTVASRLNQEKGRRFKQGDVVSYLICEDGSTNSSTQRAYDLTELNDLSKNLKIDVNYYLSQQIHPVVSRLCEPISGTDSARIADCLGLDSASYKHRLAATVVSSNNDEEDWTSLINPSLNTEYCAPYTFTCFNPDCNTVCEIRSTFIGTGKDIAFSLAKCPNAKCKDTFGKNSFLLTNILKSAILDLISRYYANWMICDDLTCAYRTRRVNFTLENGQTKCPTCRRNTLKQEISEKSVYAQLSFFQNIFDLDNAMSRLSKEDRELLSATRTDVKDIYKELHRTVQHFVHLNSYSQIDLGKLFKGLRF